MIAFATPVAESEAYRKYAEPGIRRALEPDSELLAFAGLGQISRSYNVLLDAAVRQEGLEAVVLVHPHCEILDPDLCGKVRARLADPDVAVVGVAGARNVKSLAWWEYDVRGAQSLNRYTEHGGGEVPAFSWVEHWDAAGEVDVVDGFLLALSPWAARTLRFDEALRTGFGFETDFCLQVRAASRKVVTADIATVNHHSLELVEEIELWAEAHLQIARKWRHHLRPWPEDEAEWKALARRAEAEREAARAIGHAHQLEADARVALLERRLEQATSTASWQLTSPLRRINERARRVRARAERRSRAPGGSPPGR